MSTHEIQLAKKAAFLVAFKSCASITVAARIAKVDRLTHYDWIRSDPEYKEAYAEAVKVAAKTLEDEAVRRAHKGTLKPVFYQGVRCGSIREYSDTLLIFLLKGAMPNKYKERQEHTGPDGGPIEAALKVTFVKPTADAES